MQPFTQSLFLLALPSALALFVAGLIARSRLLLGLAAGIAVGLAFLVSLVAGPEEVTETKSQSTQ